MQRRKAGVGLKCDIHKLLRPAHKVVVLAACKSSADWRFLDQRGGGYIPASKHGACTEERRTVAQPNDVAISSGFAEEAPIRAAQKKNGKLFGACVISLPRVAKQGAILYL